LEQLEEEIADLEMHAESDLDDLEEEPEPVETRKERQSRINAGDTSERIPRRGSAPIAVLQPALRLQKGSLRTAFGSKA